MSPLDAANWILSFVALSGMALLLRALSRRLGDALHVKKYYYLYDAGIVVLASSMTVMLLGYGQWFLPARLLFLLGAALILGATARYWAWILPEIFMQSK